MIVKNEEKNIGTCLQSVTGLVGEIILVDTGSTDRTIEIAADFSPAVFHMDWPGDFSKARNFSIQQAIGEWILVLDADEELPVITKELIPDLLNACSVDGIRLLQRNYQPQGELVRYNDIKVTRLFRNHPEIQYEGIIHESVSDSIGRKGGDILQTDLVIHHYGYQQMTAQGNESRGQRNCSLLIKALESSGEDPYLHFQLGSTYKHLRQPDLARFHLRKAVSLNRGTLTNEILEEIFMKLAQIASEENKLEDCIRYAKGSLGYGKNNVISMYLLALAYMHQKKIDKAYPLFLKIKNYAALLSSQTELDQVIAYCQQVIQEKK